MYRLRTKPPPQGRHEDVPVTRIFLLVPPDWYGKLAVLYVGRLAAVSCFHLRMWCSWPCHYHLFVSHKGDASGRMSQS